MKKLFISTVVVAWVLSAAAVSVRAATELQIGGPPDAAGLTYQTLDEGKLLVSVTDAQDQPMLGLGPDHFSIRSGPRTAKILSVEPLETSKEVALQIILVVDNSASMKLRKAIEPLKSALEAFYRTLRPMDIVTAVVFDESGTITVDGRALHARVKQAGDVGTLRGFIEDSMGAGLTFGTYLHDAMFAGLDVAQRMKPGSHKFLVVFSDGEDINSIVKPEEIKTSAAGIGGLTVLAVDYMPQGGIDPFLYDLSTRHGGRAWKAASAAELLPVFEAFSSIMLHRYVVTYRFLDPPRGSLAFGAPQLTIEEVTTIDSSPLLNHIYFETGQSELPGRYTLFGGPERTSEFDEKNLRGAMEKYGNVLNVIGQRLRMHPEAAIRLVGCNSDTGVEKGRADLSRSRAEAVRAYLRYVWGIDPQRMAVEHRNLPDAPSTNRIPEGQAENQRVEIYSDNEVILDTVDSAFVQKVCEAENLRIIPDIQSEAGLAEWRLTLQGGGKEIKTIQGQGALPAEWSVPLDAGLVEALSACQAIELRMSATDRDANALGHLESTSLPVNFIQRSRQTAQVQGYKVKEQYALILFDYDSAGIKSRNKVIVDRIINRLNEVPEALISVVGHTDTIGSEAYNLKLSEKRSQAVHAAMIAAMPTIAGRLHVAGVGPHSPLYDNGLPEGRSLNRTVTVTLEYLHKD